MIFKNVNAILPKGETICDVRICNGCITEFGEHIEQNIDEIVRDCTNKILMPGFIDTHNHGGLSKAFFHEDIDLSKIMTAYASRGTTAILPTFSCMPLSQFKSSVSRIIEFENNKIGTKIAGIHAEGPFLNPVRGGGMIQEYIQQPSVEYFKEMYDACKGLLRIITIAPEMQGSQQVIQYALNCGVKVSAGHTDATYDEMKSAIDNGITRATHLFNAARPINHREPGVISAALNDSRVNCEVICDFSHIHPATVEMIWKQKGCKAFTMVSDYSDRNGKAARGEGEHIVDGQKYTVRNGVAWSETGSVLGTSNDMLVGVQNLYNIGVPLAEIAVMASENPAKAAGVFEQTGSICVGKAADLVLLDNELCVIDVYVDGCCVTKNA